MPPEKNYFLSAYAIPPHAHRQPVGSEEVVPGASELAVDANAAGGADKGLVLNPEAPVPRSTGGASLGGTRLGGIDDVTTRVANGRGLEAFAVLVVAPRRHHAHRLGLNVSRFIDDHL